MCSWSFVISFFCSSFTLEDVDDIYKALDKYVEAEVLTEGNQYTCGKCNKKVDALKGLRFKELPFLLCLHLKRFDFNWDTMDRIKLNNRVSFPFVLDMTKYIPLDHHDSSHTYELFAVCNASGGAMGGHYFSYLKQ